MSSNLTALISAEQVMLSLAEFGEDPTADRVDAVRTRLAAAGLPIGVHDSAFHEAVDSARTDLALIAALPEEVWTTAIGFNGKPLKTPCTLIDLGQWALGPDKEQWRKARVFASGFNGGGNMVVNAACVFLDADCTQPIDAGKPPSRIKTTPVSTPMTHAEHEAEIDRLQRLIAFHDSGKKNDSLGLAEKVKHNRARNAAQQMFHEHTLNYFELVEEPSPLPAGQAKATIAAFTGNPVQKTTGDEALLVRLASFARMLAEDARGDEPWILAARDVIGGIRSTRPELLPAKTGFAWDRTDQPVAATAKRVLVTVSGGVADFQSDAGVDVEVFDFDNYRDDPVNTAPVPEHFRDLAQLAGVPLPDKRPSDDSPSLDM